MMKRTIVKKAYEIPLEKLDEGYLSSPIICHAENENKAKAALLKEVQNEGWKLNNGEDITYLNIPVRRYKEFDIVLFEGQEVSANEIEGILWQRERTAHLDGILNNPAIKYCYIRKGNYYGPNNCGYTEYKFQAGVYTKEEAVKSAKSVDNISLEPIDIEKHNAMIQDKLKDLATRLIPCEILATANPQ